jgi:hypothetical protein
LLRSVPVPEVLGQPLSRDDLVRGQQQQGENGTLADPTQGDGHTVVDGLNRPQDAELHVGGPLILGISPRLRPA